jgi:hypothetical protein
MMKSVSGYEFHSRVLAILAKGAHMTLPSPVHYTTPHSFPAHSPYMLFSIQSLADIRLQSTAATDKWITLSIHLLWLSHMQAHSSSCSVFLCVTMFQLAVTQVARVQLPFLFFMRQ